MSYADRSVLWNAVENSERNDNSQLAREIEFSLPRELSIEQNIKLAHEFVQKTFVSAGMEKNKKAPARAKAVEDFYQLTTKLFCGHCEAAMTGFSGTSHTGKFHQYYGCVTQRRKGG